MPEVTPNVGADPINPAYYGGTACAEIIEHMPTNVAFAVKYAWRLGEKDSESQEASKAIWYLEREIKRQKVGDLTPGSWFERVSRPIVQAAYLSDKLDQHRVGIVWACCRYVFDGDVNHLHNAIGMFKIYIK